MGKLNKGGNMKKRKKKKKKTRKLFIAILFFSFILSYYEFNSDYNFGSIIRDIIFYPSRNIDDKKLLNSLENELINENEKLKIILDINYSLNEFDVINATIVERNSSFWFEEFTINRGIIDNVYKNMIVVTNEGAVGIVKNSSLFTSKIKLLTSNKNMISVSINGNNKIMSSSNNKLFIRGINEKDNIKVGDKVLTSGLSDIFPKGILIGNISELIKNEDNVGYTGVVALSSDINDLRFVSVLRRKNK